MFRRLLLIALLLLVPGSLLAAPAVVVKGLFKDKAVLAINGQTRLIKVGESSPEGVRLIACDSERALVEIEGQTQELKLSQEIAATFTQAQFNEVRIARSPDSHYRVTGQINGRPATMMVDTGATSVVMNLEEARRLGIDYRNGQKGFASTAGGIVDSYMVKLEQVSVGNIQVQAVQGAVIIGDFPEQILLGNSFLSRVSLQDEQGVLLIRSKY